jgi:hypothetical protein
LTKQCKLCYPIIKPETLKLGLFNVGDLYLVSWDIFFTLRNTIRISPSEVRATSRAT